MNRETPSQSSNSAANRAELLRRMLSGRDTPTSAPAIPHANNVTRAPALPLQHSMWFVDHMSSGDAPYTMGTAVKFGADLDSQVLQDALDTLVQRHAALRTTLHVDNGQLQQKIHPRAKAELTESPLLPDETHQRRAMRDALLLPIPLDCLPVLRAILWRGSSHCIIELKIHHANGDGTTMRILVEELLKLLDGEELPPAPQITQADVALWLDHSEFSTQLDYWQHRLHRYPPLSFTHLPQDPTPSDQLSNVVEFDLPSHTGAALAELTTRLHCTAFMTALASFQALLCLVTGRHRICMGTAVDRRLQWGLGPVAGCLINTVALADNIDLTDSFEDLVLAARDTVNDAFANADVPFEQVIHTLSEDQTKTSDPICNVYLVDQRLPTASTKDPQVVAMDPTGAQFDLICHWMHSGKRTRIGLVAHPSACSKAGLEHMARIWQRLLTEALTAPNSPIEQLFLGEATLEAGGTSRSASIPATTSSRHPDLRMPETRSENRTSTVSDGEHLVLGWVHRLQTIPPAQVVHIESGDAAASLPIVLAAWRASCPVQISSPLPACPPRVRYHNQSWLLENTEFDFTVPDAPIAPIRGTAWTWQDGSVLSHDELRSALNLLEDHLVNDLGVNSEAITLLGPPTPLSTIALRPEHRVEYPRRGIRPHVAIGRAMDIVHAPLPPQTAIVTDAATPEFSRWAYANDITLCCAVLLPGIGLFLSKDPAMLEHPRNAEAWIANPKGIPLPYNCPGQLYVRTGADQTHSLPWRLIQEQQGNQTVFRWFDHPPQPWPPVSAAQLVEALDRPVNTAITNQGVIEFTATGQAAELATTAQALGMWPDLIHPITPLADGHIVIDEVVTRQLTSIAQNQNSTPTAIPVLKFTDGTVKIFQSSPMSVAAGRTASVAAPFMAQFLDMCRRYPKHTAAIVPASGQTPSRCMSYAELAEAVGRQARRLRANGIHYGSIVAVQGGPDLETLVSILAVAWCGGTWVPLDRTHPLARRMQVVDVVNPDLLIADCDEMGVRHVVPHAASQESDPEEVTCPTPSRPEDLAYVIFTSGSTGRPKGVRITQQALSNLIASIAKLVGFGPGSVICWQTTPAFDISLVETIMPLTRGGTVVICPPDISRDPELFSKVARNHGVTHIQASPRMWSTLLTTGNIPETIVRMTGGESLPLSIARQLAQQEAWNLYGPTETTVWSSAARLVAPIDHVKIGRPLDNTLMAVVDEEGHPVPVGEVGEIVIGGVGVSPGYWNNAPETRQRFIKAEWANPGEAVYRTGDRGRLDPDGQFVCLGREDGQVKIHGYRVELGDIEQALEQDDAITRGLIHLIDETVCALVLPQDGPEERCAAWKPTPNWPPRDDIDGSLLGDDVIHSHLEGLIPLIAEQQGSTAIIASEPLAGYVRDLDLGPVLPDLDALSETVESIVVLAADRRFADLDNLSDFCEKALELVSVDGRLILADIMSPGRHSRVHQLRTEAAQLDGELTDPPWLLVDPDELLGRLGRPGHLRPRLAATSMGDHRFDLVVINGGTTSPIAVVSWQEKLTDPAVMHQFLENALEGTALIGIPRDVFRAEKLAHFAGPRWRVHDDGLNFTLVSGPETPPRNRGIDQAPWFYRDPALLAWEQSTLPDIKRRMAERVPPYMVPSRIRAVARFPATANDKVDRRVANRIWDTQTVTGTPRKNTAPEVTFYEHFAAMVQTHSHQVAIDGPEGSWTYHQLAQRVDALARRLLAAGLHAGSRIVVAVARSNHFVTAILAIARIQASFIPLDVTQPAIRNSLIINDSRAHGAITDAANRGLVANLRTIINITDKNPAPAIPLPETGDPDAEAYVIFTSGTSGRPKGVRVAHRGIATILDLHQDRLTTGPGRRILQFAAPGFDALIWELSLSLLHGGTIVMRGVDALRPGPDLVTTLRDDSITDIVLPPSVLGVLPPDETLPENLTIVAAGEALTSTLVDRYAGHVALFNAYGPTECTVVTHMSQRLQVGDSPVIGEPAPGIDACVITDTGELASPNQIGELYVGGRSLAIGYLEQPDLNEQAFTNHPSNPSLRVYRTGDMVTIGKDGSLTYQGRRDDQLKIRGFRVEPSEVEAVINALPGIHYAVVAPFNASDGPRLAAFVVGGDPSLADELTHRLPAPMVPEIHFRDELPTNANGKVDRSALVMTLQVHNDRPSRSGGTLGVLTNGSAPPQIIAHLQDRHGRTVPVTRWQTASLPGPRPQPTEVARLIRIAERTIPGSSAKDQLTEQIRQVWQDVLDMTVPADDIDFFSVGGHSLSAAHVVLRLRELGHDLSVADFFAHPTITDLSRLIRGNRRDISDEELTAAACLPADIDPSACTPVNTGQVTAPKNIMITGATGFMGARLVLALLHNTDATIHALVRGDDLNHATGRLRSAVERFGIKLDEGQRARLRVLHGDLHAPQLGLDARTMNELETTIDVIFHLGASVNLLDSFDHMIAPNVLGTTQMLRLATTGRLKPFHHISTIATILGAAWSGREIDEQIVIAPSEVLRTGYVMTKWVGEQLVTEARRRGLPASIYRLSRVAQDRVTGVHNPADAQLLFLAGAIQVGTYPDASEDFSSSPYDAVCVDDLCEWLIALALSEEQNEGNYHLISPHCLTLRQVGDQLRAAGFPLKRTTLEKWTEDLAHNAQAEEHTTVQFSSDLRNMSAALPELGTYVLNTIKTQEALHGLGVTQRVIDEELMARHIQHLITSGFFPYPPPPDSEDPHA